MSNEILENELVVSSIVELSMNKIALWISVPVDDWTAELAIFVSNVHETDRPSKLQEGQGTWCADLAELLLWILL